MSAATKDRVILALRNQVDSLRGELLLERNENAKLGLVLAQQRVNQADREYREWMETDPLSGRTEP